MENSTDKNRKEGEILKDEKMNESEVDGNLIQKEVIANQGSEEQKMKEKYISEVSKIEDAPGDGGTDNNRGLEN